MATLPADRTKLALAQTNQVASAVASAKRNIDTLTEIYDTVDLLNQKVDNHANAAILAHADGSVTTAKLATGAITEPKYATGSVSARAVANGVLTADKFVPGALTNETQNALRITALEGEVDEHLAETATQIVNIHKFPRLAGETTDDARIRRALDSLPEGRGIIDFDGEVYDTIYPIVLGWFQGLRGIYGKTIIQKTGNATDPDHPYDSIVGMSINTDDGQSLGNTINGITFKGLSNNAYGINLQKSTHLDITNVFVNEVQIGINGTVVWLATYTNVVVRNVGDQGNIAFNIADGTSNLFNRCWARAFDGGFNLGATMYCDFNACVAEGFTKYGYTGGSGVTYNGCGVEAAILASGGYCFGNGARTVVINGGQAVSISTDQTAGSSSLFYFNGSQATITGFRLTSFQSASLIDTVKVDVDGCATFNNCQLPSNPFRVANVTNALGRVVVNVGDTSTHYFSNTNNNYVRSSSDYELGMRKGTASEVLGKITTVPWSANGMIFRNTHLAASGTVKQLLKIDSLPAGNGTVSFNFRIWLAKTGAGYGSSLYEGFGTIINGTKNAVTLTKVYGLDMTVSIAWNSDFLECNVGEASASAIVETSVFQRVSSAEIKMLWM